MITVDKYIRKLLFEHDCVIIPEFGGLLTHHVGAHYDSVNSLFLPARRRLAFNEVLKIDDGLLTYYVAAHEKLSREEAAHQIRRYVDLLRQQLTDGGSVDMEAIGVFVANSEGKLVFEPDYSQNYTSECFGLYALPVREVNRASSGTDEETVLTDSEVEFVASGATTQSSRTWVNWAAAAVLVGAVTLLSTLSTSSENPSLLSTLNPFETVKEFSLESYTTNETYTPTLVENTVIEVEPIVKEVPKPKLAPVEVVAYVPKSERRTLEVKEVSEPRHVVKKNQAPKVPVAVAKKEVKPQTAENRYFLIAGSFGRLKNANELKEQLVRKGFTESSVLENAGGKLVKVSAGSFASMEGAMSQKRKVDAATGDQCWVYHQK